MNPFLKLSVSTGKKFGDNDSRLLHKQQKQRSSVAIDSNASPKWNEDFVFDISAHDRTLDVICCDADLVNGDRIIGLAEVDLAEPLSRQGETIEQTVVIEDENVANRGEVNTCYPYAFLL